MQFKILSFIVAVTCCHLLCSTGVEKNANKTSSAAVCEKWSKLHVKWTSVYTLSSNVAFVRFDTMSRLNISCYHRFIDESINSLILYTTNKHNLIDYSFDIRSLLNAFRFDNHTKAIYFYYLSGFNLKLDNSNEKNKVEHNISHIFFHNSPFDFYVNESRLITPDLCVRANFEQQTTPLNFGESTVFFNCYYTQSLCPYVFLNSPVKYLAFDQISNSLIYKNRLGFLSINESDYLNVFNLQSLAIVVAYEHITLQLINTNVFKDMVSVFLEGYLYGIQEDLFDTAYTFLYLKVIFLQVDNLRVLFSQGIAWIQYLNRDLDRNVTLIDPERGDDRLV